MWRIYGLGDLILKLLLKVLVVEGVDRNPPLEDVRINGRKMLR
jgi:hypothetical protein